MERRNFLTKAWKGGLGLLAAAGAWTIMGPSPTPTPAGFSCEDPDSFSRYGPGKHRARNP